MMDAQGNPIPAAPAVPPAQPAQVVVDAGQWDQLRTEHATMRDQGNQLLATNQQMATQLQALEAQLRDLDPRGPDPERRLKASLEALKKLPEYKHDGKITWSAFLNERKRWIKLYSMEQHASEDFQKNCLLFSIKDKAGEMMEDLETDDVIAGLSLDQLLKRLTELFQPPAESAIFKQSFEERKQKPREDMVEYMASKEALYKKAYSK